MIYAIMEAFPWETAPDDRTFGCCIQGSPSDGYLRQTHIVPVALAERPC
jgi:hypothetical protein